MAHELTLRHDGRYEMAFVGETPWHGLGQNVTKGASIGVWAKEAGMDWEAREGVPLIGHPDNDAIYFDDYKALYRSDNDAPLAIVGSGYQPHQPREILEFFREFTEGGGWHIHTAGTMRGGRKLWVMATCEDAQRFVKGHKDSVALNLLLATSLDGSMQTTGALTNVRVVCANTFRQALEGGSQAMVRLSHRSSFDSSYIKKELGVEAAQKSFAAFMESAREMAETPVTLDEAREFLTRILCDSSKKEKQRKPKLDLSWLGIDAGGAEEEQPTDSRSVGRILSLFQGEGRGADLATSKGTRWGLFNAITEHVDHEMGRTPDTRLDSAWFGRGNGFKQEAYKILTEA
jgi:phage/plasmid-like protein (TIGR03299 family)